MPRYHINVPDHVEDAGAYIAAAERRIAFNAFKTASAKFAALPDAEAIRNFLYDNSRNNFLNSLYAQLNERGNLSEKQIAMVRENMAKRDERRAALHAADLASQFVGTVGERRTFVLVAQFYTSFESMYGVMRVYGFKDDAGNVIIYKGSSSLGEVKRGDVWTFKATIKEHKTRDGIKQTILARPSRVDIQERS